MNAKTETPAEGLVPTQQSVSPSVLNTYRVSAELKYEGADAPTQLDFLISAESGKSAWVQARNLTRVGGKVQNPSHELVNLAPGIYTVRNVNAVERKDRKPRIITLDTFIEAAKAENIPLSKKVLELIERLQQSSAPKPATEAKPAEQQNTAAA